MESIIVKNARENNLKGIDVEIPLNSFTCVTGPSGCGKSSLVYDTILAESQRNFLESMSGNTYGQKLMDKPRVDSIENLKPALYISQNYYNVNPRSSIGTVTDISYYLRSMYALYASEKKDRSYDMNYFSANNPNSCCEHCKGLGEEYVISISKLIPDEEKELGKGGITYYKGNKGSMEYKTLEKLCELYGIDINTKVKNLSQKQLHNILYNEEEIELVIRYKSPKGRMKQKSVICKGVIPELKELLKDIETPSTYLKIGKFLDKDICSSCKGSRLKSEVLEITIENKNISEVEKLSLIEVMKWLECVENGATHYLYAEHIIQLVQSVKKRVQCLINLKLEYLSLGRSIPTLSGGEVQRVRLAKQLTCSLSGIVYILDEPCKGLHYRNIHMIVEACKLLVHKGNTIIAIEHNKQYISKADNIIELGLKGGIEGGYIVSTSGNIDSYKYDINFKKSEKIENYISVRGISLHNLKNINVQIPIGNITCVTGVSGSGKSTLTKVIAQCCELKRPVYSQEVKNVSKIKKVLYVNQQPIGKTPRSTVVSYLGIYDEIRDIFASCSKSKILGLKSSDFSMNVEGGRCEVCQGTGKQKVEISFIADACVTCPECKGKRFREDILSVQYAGYNISDILDCPVTEIENIFRENARISTFLRCMIDMGIGYISLGQMSMNLSGGEAQRVKLVKCLGVKSTGKNMYILDEPTSGLNSQDIELFENVIERLQKAGETILIIEHNIEFIAKIANYIIDLGKEAGNMRRDTIIQGTPECVVQNIESSWDEYKKFL